MTRGIAESWYHLTQSIDRNHHCICIWSGTYRRWAFYGNPETWISRTNAHVVGSNPWQGRYSKQIKIIDRWTQNRFCLQLKVQDTKQVCFFLSQIIRLLYIPSDGWKWRHQMKKSSSHRSSTKWMRFSFLWFAVYSLNCWVNNCAFCNNSPFKHCYSSLL